MSSPRLSRKEFIASAAALAAGGLLGSPARAQETSDITLEDLKSAEKLFGLTFTDEERAAVLSAVRSSRRSYEALRALNISYQVEPPTIFRPLADQASEGRATFSPRAARAPQPKATESLAHATISELRALLDRKQVSPVELTKMYLDRIGRYGDKLLNIVSVLEDRAMKAARKAESELMSGKRRGVLHGIPYGLKDLFATKGDLTTWGSEPHREQRFDYDAAVVERLEQAGAVLVAKTSLGSLAMGDVWFKGRTKNPWNIERGSSGSSAGSASGVAAGLFAFAIGTETMGSIMSPSHECRVTGLRPTYGRVSRYGGMAVSWTMDKVGPICRTAEDCMLVLNAIAGADPRDPSSVSSRLDWPPRLDLSKAQVGYLIGQSDDPSDKSRLDKDDYLKLLVREGVKLRPVKFDPLPTGVNMILGIEAAAAFDDFTRSERDDLLKNSTWPTFYRQNRYTPAVEYLQAQRARTIAMRRFQEQWTDLAAVVANERGGPLLFLTNYTGHPQILVPNGVDERGVSRSVSFFARPYQEGVAAYLARLLQDATQQYRRHPDDSAFG